MRTLMFVLFVTHKQNKAQPTMVIREALHREALHREHIHREQLQRKVFFQKLTNTPDTTAEYDPKDIADNKLLALLSYIGILVLIPMFVAPNSKFTRYHVRQGFTLFLADVGVAIINYLLGLIKVTRYIWGIPYQTTPGIIGFISWILGIPLFCLSIIGIINAYQGKAMELPFIGKIQIIK